MNQTVDIYGVPFLIVDLVALAWFAACWLGFARYADRQYHGRVNLIRIMDDLRMRWMRQMIERENRITDATLIGNILRSIYFFSSTTILILIGLFTAMGAENTGIKVLDSLPFATGSTPLMWEVKVSLLMLIFIYAFFKFTWSLRQYNYACVIVGSAPPTSQLKPHHYEYAAHAGRLLGNAARHFNMGLRAYYYGMGAISWFISGYLFLATTALVVYVLYRREFRSHTVNNLVMLDEA